VETLTAQVSIIVLHYVRAKVYFLMFDVDDGALSLDKVLWAAQLQYISLGIGLHIHKLL